MTEIVKVQRPIGGNDPENHWLIYDESRECQNMIPQDRIPMGVQVAMRNDAKAFFKATLIPSLVGDLWDIHERVPNQDW